MSAMLICSLNSKLRKNFTWVFGLSGRHPYLVSLLPEHNHNLIRCVQVVYYVQYEPDLVVRNVHCPEVLVAAPTPRVSGAAEKKVQVGPALFEYA